MLVRRRRERFDSGRYLRDDRTARVPSRPGGAVRAATVPARWAEPFELRHFNRPLQPYDGLRWPVDAQSAYRQGAHPPEHGATFPLSTPRTSKTTTTTARPPRHSTAVLPATHRHRAARRESCGARALGRQHRSGRTRHVRRAARQTPRRSAACRKCADGLGDPVHTPAGTCITGKPGASQFGTVSAPLDTDGASAGRGAPTVLYANETPLRCARSVLAWPDPAAASVDSRAHGHRCAESTVHLR